MGSQQSRESYEAVARYFLSRFREVFGLERVDPKQKIAGSSRTSWEIDAKGMHEGNNSAIMLVECRQHRLKRLDQEAVGGLAYRIIDIGASGGIVEWLANDVMHTLPPPENGMLFEIGEGSHVPKRGAKNGSSTVNRGHAHQAHTRPGLPGCVPAHFDQSDLTSTEHEEKVTVEGTRGGYLTSSMAMQLTNAWFQKQYCLLVIRWERIAACFEAYLAIATRHIWIHRLLVG